MFYSSFQPTWDFIEVNKKLGYITNSNKHRSLNKMVTHRVKKLLLDGTLTKREYTRKLLKIESVMKGVESM